MMKLLRTLAWITRTAIGLGIACLFAILAYATTSLMSWPDVAKITEALPSWVHMNLGPSILLALVSALLIRARLNTLALGGLLSSLFVLLFGTPKSPPQFIEAALEEIFVITSTIFAIQG